MLAGQWPNLQRLSELPLVSGTQHIPSQLDQGKSQAALILRSRQLLGDNQECVPSLEDR